MAQGSIAGSGLSAYGAIVKGKSTADALNAQADVQVGNAKEALAQGQYDAARQQLVSNQKIGSIKAAFGASGVTSDSGSVMDVLAASTANAELDRQNILHGADIKAVNYMNQASIDRLGAESAISGSYWEAFGDVSQAAGKVAQMAEAAG